MGDDLMRKLRNFFIKGFLHIWGLAMLFWVIGALMALTTNQYNLIELNLDPILVAYKWSIWVFKSWKTLAWSSYKWMKAKILLSLFIPLIIAGIIYKRKFHDILEWDPIVQKEKVFGNASWALVNYDFY